MGLEVGEGPSSTLLDYGDQRFFDLSQVLEPLSPERRDIEEQADKDADALRALLRGDLLVGIVERGRLALGRGAGCEAFGELLDSVNNDR